MHDAVVADSWFVALCVFFSTFYLAQRLLATEKKMVTTASGTHLLKEELQRREELLSTVDSAKEQADIPAPVLARAYATIHTWYWMESRRLWHQRDLAPQVA
jgi:hypothetical protein